MTDLSTWIAVDRIAVENALRVGEKQPPVFEVHFPQPDGTEVVETTHAVEILGPSRMVFGGLRYGRTGAVHAWLETEAEVRPVE